MRVPAGAVSPLAASPLDRERPQRLQLLRRRRRRRRRCRRVFVAARDQGELLVAIELKRPAVRRARPNNHQFILRRASRDIIYTDCSLDLSNTVCTDQS